VLAASLATVVFAAAVLMAVDPPVKKSDQGPPLTIYREPDDPLEPYLWKAVRQISAGF
jgi:hypothetical protein